MTPHGRPARPHLRPPTWMALVSAEWLKVRTVRLPALLAATAVALTLVLALQPVLSAGRNGSPSLGTAGALLAVIGSTSRGPLVALVLGVLVVTAEHRHATLTPVLLQTPSRARLLAAKSAFAAMGGLGLGLLGLATSLSVGALSGAVRPGLLNADIAWRVTGLALAHPLYALLGVGVGALAARSQPVAVLIPVVWLLFGEAMVVNVVDARLLPWSLNGAVAALANAGDLAGVLPIWAGGLLLLACASVAVGAGTVRTVRADVT